jgi:hypothetical protein
MRPLPALACAAVIGLGQQHLPTWLALLALLILDLLLFED